MTPAQQLNRYWLADVDKIIVDKTIRIMTIFHPCARLINTFK